MTEKHTCPRRAENGMGQVDGPFRGGGLNLDSYEPRYGLVGQARGCSYCGSMNPDDFMEALRSGKEIGPTDKSYKFYIHEALTEEEKSTLRTQQIARSVSAGLTDQEALLDAELDPKMLGQGARIGKFYTQHLSEEQGWEFDSLWKDHKINWGYPGAPYVKLYIPGPSTKS